MVKAADNGHPQKSNSYLVLINLVPILKLSPNPTQPNPTLHEEHEVTVLESDSVGHHCDGDLAVTVLDHLTNTSPFTLINTGKYKKNTSKWTHHVFNYIRFLKKMYMLEVSEAVHVGDYLGVLEADSQLGVGLLHP
ncbi:hypothetical protein Pcinc_032268 [Petrolisthes cinctipes]|uniref:Uncharacterized protein n=1 Tax=Petrolisthes cinctipes TaxID=88211 RepID=A0AAE1EUF9_PETCI|nr:hypothetical protein Pcinc_032268 [Petrolisthes cinctipes]